jgi:hypothetical protein
MNERIRELAKEAAREMNETGTYSEPKFQEKFARVYLAEKRMLLEVLTRGDATLMARARSIVGVE